MTTTERDPSHGGYEAASERRSEPKEPPMTKTQDELLAAVETALVSIDRIFPVHVTETPDYAELAFNECGAQAMTIEPHTWTALNGLGDDLRLILAALRSPDPEVERLRGALSWISKTNFGAERAVQTEYENALGLCVCEIQRVARAALSSNSGGR